MSGPGPEGEQIHEMSVAENVGKEIHVPPMTLIVNDEPVEEPSKASEIVNPEKPKELAESVEAKEEDAEELEEPVEGAEKVADEQMEADLPAHEVLIGAARRVIQIDNQYRDFCAQMDLSALAYARKKQFEDEVIQEAYEELLLQVSARRRDRIPEEHLSEVIALLFEAMHGSRMGEYHHLILIMLKRLGVNDEAIANFVASREDANEWTVFHCKGCKPGIHVVRNQYLQMLLH